MDRTFEIAVPPCYSEKNSIDRNPIRQLLERQQTATAIQDSNGNISIQLENGEIIRVQARQTNLDLTGRMLILPALQLKDLSNSHDLSFAKWVGNLKLSIPSDVRNSYIDALRYIEDEPDTGRSVYARPSLALCMQFLAIGLQPLQNQQLL